MHEKLLSEMVEKNLSCKFITDNTTQQVKEVITRPKVVIDSLTGKFKEEDVLKTATILESSIAFNQLYSDLCSGCAGRNCMNKCKGMRVMPSGNIGADIMFVNKMPTDYETARRTSGCDTSGLFMTFIMNLCNVPRNAIYFTDIIKCNTMLNEPSFNECINHYFMKEIELVNPSIIICNGLPALKSCISNDILKGLPKDVTYGNIYTATLANGKSVKVTPIYDLSIVLQKTGEEYTKCKNDLWKQLCRLFKE